MDIKKIIILENESLRDADNEREKEIAQASFPNLPVEIWDRFYFGFTKLDNYQNWERFAQADLPATLFLTRTQLCGGPVSGYGDLIKMWVTMFEEIHNRGFSPLKICVLTYPSFHWQLIQWVQGANGSATRKARATLLRNVLGHHCLFTMGYSDHEFYKALRVDKIWLRMHMFPHYAPFVMDGKNCQLGYLKVSHEKVGYTYSTETERGSWVSSSMDKTLSFDEVRQLLKKPKTVKNG